MNCAVCAQIPMQQTPMQNCRDFKKLHNGAFKLTWKVVAVFRKRVNPNIVEAKSGSK
jgi:hypothetical protein